MPQNPPTQTQAESSIKLQKTRPWPLAQEITLLVLRCAKDLVTDGSVPYTWLQNVRRTCRAFAGPGYTVAKDSLNEFSRTITIHDVRAWEVTVLIGMGSKHTLSNRVKFNYEEYLSAESDRGNNTEDPHKIWKHPHLSFNMNEDSTIHDDIARLMLTMAEAGEKDIVLPRLIHPSTRITLISMEEPTQERIRRYAQLLGRIGSSQKEIYRNHQGNLTRMEITSSMDGKRWGLVPYSPNGGDAGSAD